LISFQEYEETGLEELESGFPESYAEKLYSCVGAVLHLYNFAEGWVMECILVYV